MSGNQLTKEDIDNAYKINTTIKPILDDIIVLSRQATSINPFNPLSYIELRKISRRKEDKRLRFYENLDLCYSTLNIEITDGRFALTQLQILGKGLVAALKLQDAWRDLGGTLDGKLSLNVAMLAIYVSIISLIIAIIPFLWKAFDP
jgi:hypothetical protein